MNRTLSNLVRSCLVFLSFFGFSVLEVLSFSSQYYPIEEKREVYYDFVHT